MKRSLVAVVLLALSSVSSFALAGEKTAKKFPMSAQEFKQKHEAHVSKAKAKLEERIKAKNVDPEKAKLLRARFESASAKVGQAVAKVTADGTVTKDEAKDVRSAAKEARKASKGTRSHEKHAAKTHKASSKAPKKSEAKDASETSKDDGKP
jgi:hypothetical protein